MKKIIGVLMSFVLVLCLVTSAASANSKENNDPFKDKRMHVQIVLFDGFDLLDALAPYEVFAAAGMYSKGCYCSYSMRWYTAACDGRFVER
jgi:hypothetical protein